MSTLTSEAARLRIALDEQLELAQTLPDPLLSRLQKSIDACNASIQSLKEMTINHPFSGPEEEIDFFKTIKPGFVAELLYYGKVHLIHSRWPLGGADVQKEYLRKALLQFQQFFEDNFEFYMYYRNEGTDRDQQYFLRNNRPGCQFMPAGIYINGDPLSTGYDLLVASIRAFDRLVDYVGILLASPDPRTVQQGIGTTSQSGLPWTASITDFVEFVYTLKELRCINNGQSTLKELFENFGKVFNITGIKDYYGFWIAIRARKGKPSFAERMLEAFKRACNKRGYK